MPLTDSCSPVCACPSTAHAQALSAMCTGLAAGTSLADQRTASRCLPCMCSHASACLQCSRWRPSSWRGGPTPRACQPGPRAPSCYLPKAFCAASRWTHCPGSSGIGARPHWLHMWHTGAPQQQLCPPWLVLLLLQLLRRAQQPPVWVLLGAAGQGWAERSHGSGRLCRACCCPDRLGSPLLSSALPCRSCRGRPKLSTHLNSLGALAQLGSHLLAHTQTGTPSGGCLFALAWLSSLSKLEALPSVSMQPCTLPQAQMSCLLLHPPLGSITV